MGDADEVERGRSTRRVRPRSALGGWEPSRSRPDPVQLLLAQDEHREPDLVPIRHARMSASAFAFYRGAAAVMAADLAELPTTGFTVQLCGDAHLSNLGVYASPERRLVFDLNDFDETLPGPWEWDLLRLATSFEIAARHRGLGRQARGEITGAVTRTYRETLTGFAGTGVLDTWYARMEPEKLLDRIQGRRRERVERQLDKARRRTSLHALERLTERVGGRLRFRYDPPLLVPLAHAVGGEADELADAVRRTFEEYRSTLPDSRRMLLEGYRLLDVAHKVVGVGSVGLRAFVVLLAGRGEHDALLLQVKEATASVLEHHLGPSRYAHHGQRVVEGQLAMQAASDIFLGWSTGVQGRHYYWRQLRDMKGSSDIETLRRGGFTVYARMCGWTLARAHARTGPVVAMSAYLGRGDVFDRAVTEFAHRYADQNERDHERHLAAIGTGEVPVQAETPGPARVEAARVGA